MIDHEQVLAALRGVQDPELEKSIVELGMIHDIEIGEGSVRLTLALTTLACPLRERIVDDARGAVLALDGIGEAQVDVREMTSDEKRRIWPDPPQKHKTGGAAHLNHVKQVIAVMSGKGGVGKSSVAALLAVALRRQGKQIGVLDADITGPSIPRMFGLRNAPPVGPVGILPATTTTGIRVMSINLLLPSDDDAVLWRGPLIGGAIKQFWGDVLWGELDVLVVDLPPGTSDASLTVMQAIPLNGIVLVTSPQDLAGMVVRKAAQMARQMKVPIVGVIENMSYAVCPHCGEQFDVFGPSHALHTVGQIGAPLLGRLALDPQLALHCDTGQIEAYPGEQFADIATSIASQASGRPSTPLFGSM